MNIFHFEQDIDDVIIARGKGYYNGGAVFKLAENDGDTYTARVHGTEDYTVRVILEGTEISDSECDCPYDMGPICKHQVAVFYMIQERLSHPEANGETTVIRPASRQTKGKKKEASLLDLLNAKSKKELVDLLCRLAEEYEEIEQLIQFDSANDDFDDAVSASRNLMKTYLNKYSDRCGSVNYHQVSLAMQGTYMVLEKARNAIKTEKLILALDLNLCVLHEMIAALQRIDDSDGYVGEIFKEVLDMVGEISEKENFPDNQKDEIFRKLLKEYKEKCFDEWIDIRLGILSRCAKLAHTPALRDALGKRLASLIPNDKNDAWSKRYIIEEISKIHLQMIRDFDGDEKAEEYVNQNLVIPDMREIAIQSAFERKKYDLVVQLALDGESNDSGYRGLVKQWKEHRYQAYRLLGLQDDQRRLAEEFLFDGNFEYYHEIKKIVDTTQWKALYPVILERVYKSAPGYNSVYINILVEEKEQERLINYIKATPRLIEGYYEHLLPEHYDEVTSLFIQHIEDFAKSATSRKGYKGVCDIIKTFKKACGREHAISLRQKLDDLYAKRPAFRDELSKMKV